MSSMDKSQTQAITTSMKNERKKRLMEVLNETKKMVEELEDNLRELDKKGIYGESTHKK